MNRKILNLHPVFLMISEFLLNHTVLQASGRNYRIIEVEYYYFDHETHPDPFSHQNPRQLKSWVWYFHRFPGSSSYKGGTFQGLDLCLGSCGAFSGILIRSIVSTEDNCQIYGPSNVVNALLRDSGTGKNEIEKYHVLSESNPLRLIRFEGLEKRIILTGTRIGLKYRSSLPVPQSHQQFFIDRPYRFATFPELKHRKKRTLTSVKHHISDSALFHFWDCLLNMKQIHITTLYRLFMTERINRILV